MSAHENLNPVQFNPESRPAHENYGITYESGGIKLGVPATSKLDRRNKALRETAESGEPTWTSAQAFSAESPRATRARNSGKAGAYIKSLRPVTPYGNASQN